MKTVQKQLSGLIVMLLIGAGAFAYSYFGAFKGKEKEQQQKEQAEKIADFKVDDVKLIKLKNQDKMANVHSL